LPRTGTVGLRAGQHEAPLVEGDPDTEPPSVRAAADEHEQRLGRLGVPDSGPQVLDLDRVQAVVAVQCADLAVQ
jgi:hypothetical protein